MARTLHKFKVWFQTGEGERFFQEVEAMNVESAIKKAHASLALDAGIMNIGGRKREWSVAFISEITEQAEQVTILKPDSIPPIGKVKSA